MTNFPFNYDPIKSCIMRHTTGYNNPSDWRAWRICYEGGSAFVDEFLESYTGSTGKEGADDFQRRKNMTPIPTYAKKEINRVKNSISRRLGDVSRLGGSSSFQDQVFGNGRGVDLRGSSMNAYISRKILPELLVMGKVGVLVDAPDVQAVSKADVPSSFSPYLNRFCIENIPLAIAAPNSSPSDWSHVLLETEEHDFNYLTGKNDCTVSFRYYWLDPERGGKVNVAFLDENGNESKPTKMTNLDAIPFVMVEIESSLMSDVSQHQIALLNMMSADTSYGVDSNFPFLTRQRGATDVGDHLDGGPGNDTTRAGSQYGLWYGKGLDRPGFISPPSEPLRASIDLRSEMKKEVQELVSGTLADLGGDGTLEAGLHAVGEVLKSSEERIWDFWTVYEDSRPDKRKMPTISYPDSWSLKTDEERLNEAEQFMKLANYMVGETNKKALAKKAVAVMHRGDVSSDQMDKFMKEIDDSPIAIADPDVIIKAKKEQIFCSESAAAALGAKDPKAEAEQCQTEASERAAQIVAAQTDIAGQAGNPDGQVDDKSKDIEQEGRPEVGRPANTETEDSE